LRIFILLFLLVAVGLEWIPGWTLASSSSSGQTLYDEQLGLSFTQSFRDMSFNVTAVEQCGTEGVGIGYILNGLSDSGYWYQVGLSWRWIILTNSSTYPTFPGYDAIYDVYSSNGSSLHIGGKGPMLSSMNVNQGDLVLLRMGFSNDGVTMYVHDWNTNASDQTSYDAFGASSFVPVSNAAVNHNGFFTGLMTEQYHGSPYHGDERQVTYSESGFASLSSWMWIDEYHVPYSQYSEFADSSLKTYSNPVQLVNFTSNGAFESSNAYEFVTGRLTSGLDCPQPIWQVILQRYWYFIPIWAAIIVGGVLATLLTIRRSRRHDIALPPPPPPPPL
jgi:hypothetical protein